MDIVFKPVEVTEIIKPAYDFPTIGEPISKDGVSANDSNAYGVVVGIIGDGNTRRVRVMTKGYIDYDKVKENYMEYSPECISALTGIALCTGGKYPAGSDPAVESAKQTGGFGWQKGEDIVETLVDNIVLQTKQEEHSINALFPNGFPIVARDTYEVTYDGVVYTVNAFRKGFRSILGDNHFDLYPFFISNEWDYDEETEEEYNVCRLYTPEVGEHTITIKHTIKNIEYINPLYIKEIPPVPEQEGVYALNCEIIDGEAPTFYWYPELN